MKKQSAGRRVRREKIRRKKMQVREKVGKSRNTVFFLWFCGSGGLKSRLTKAAGAETSGEMRDEKLHAVVARSTFPSQNARNTPLSDHFWKLRCWKSARRCGAKHNLKSKCTKHTRSGPLLEVEMSKKCTPLWREAHFQVKMYKTHQVRTTFGSWDVEKGAVVARSTFPSQNVQSTPFTDHFWKLRCRKSARRCGAKHISMYKTPPVRATFGGSDVEKEHAVVARSTFRSQNVKNTRGSDHFWRFRCRFASLHYTTLHYTTLHYTTLHYTTLHYTTLQLQLHNYTPLHSTTLHYTTLHYTTLHSTTLHYITLHCTTFHYTSVHYTTLHYTTATATTTQLHSTTRHSTTRNYTTLHYITLHSTTLHYITLHYLPLHFTTLHYTTLHYATTTTTTTQLHSTTRNYTTLHYITLHYIPLHSTTLHYTTIHWMTLHHR